MIVVCASCEQEGRPAFLREKPPLEDRGVSHGYCADHAARMRAEIRARQERRAFEDLVGFLTKRAPETFLRDGHHDQIAFVQKAGGGGLDIVGLRDASLPMVECFLRGSATQGARCLALVAEAWCTAARDETDLEVVELWKAERGSLADLPGLWEELVVTVSAPGRYLCRRWRIGRADGRVQLGAPQDETTPSQLWLGLWRGDASGGAMTERCTSCGGIGCSECDVEIHRRTCQDDDCKCYAVHAGVRISRNEARRISEDGP